VAPRFFVFAPIPIRAGKRVQRVSNTGPVASYADFDKLEKFFQICVGQTNWNAVS
jgi:hypothetical protein